MKINRRLNLVLEVERGDGTIAHVHHTPLPEDVYNEFWEVIVKAVSNAYMKNFMPPVAVRVGIKLIMKAAEELGVTERVEKSLLPHMWRLTTVLIKGADGAFAQTPLDVIVASGQGLEAEDVEEVKQYIAFFTCASWVHPKRELEGLLYLMLRDSGAHFVSSTSTEYATSLLTSTQDVSSGVMNIPGASAPAH